MKRIIGIFGVMLLLVACGDEERATRHNEFVPLTAITVTSEYPLIADGTSNRFTARGNFSGEFERDITDEVAWESLNPEFLTIDADGLGQGVSAGRARVTATRDGVVGDFFIDVAEATAQIVTVAPATAAIPKGLTQPFTATGTFTWAGGQIVQNITRDVAWTSSDQAIASVAGDGRATALSTGTATITATFAEDGGDVTGSATLTVTDATLQSIALSPTPLVLVKGETQQLTVTATYSDGSTQTVTSESGNWRSTRPTVATVSSSGLVTAVETGGPTEISADFGGKTDTLPVTVATVRDIVVEPASATVTVNGTVQLTATASLSSGGSKIVTDRATWTPTGTNSTSIAVDSKGLVTGKGVGTAQVTASLDGVVSPSVTIVVEP